ncbi:MAG: thiamine pyrophosphate-dependent enzyme [Phycisphaerae bacterium]
MGPTDRVPLLRSMARMRAFELGLLELFRQGQLYGTTHTCVGQEMVPAALYPHLDSRRDVVFSNHRCHGHFLAFGGPPAALLAEIMGKQGAVCQGRGGSQHLCYRPHGERKEENPGHLTPLAGGFFSNGVQGGGMPIAAGVAWAKQRADKGGMVVCHIGDGTLGEGIVYETLNLLSLYQLPVLIVLEHNGWAQSTATAGTTAGDVLARFTAFGLAADRRRAEEPEALTKHFGEVVAQVRGGGGKPFVQIVDTFRLQAHSKGDDNRPAELIQSGWTQDYLDKALKSQQPAAVAAWQEAQDEIRLMTQEVAARPEAELEQVQVYAPADTQVAGAPAWPDSVALSARPQTAAVRINEVLNASLNDLMAASPEVVLIGEDLADPYGGAFKVTRGLSTRYPGRVLSTPISEAAITGLATGMALAGQRPIVEIMFGDFVTLAMDQLINHAAKMHAMYAGQVCVPLTLRLVSGGYRGYGATHSQSLESRLCGVPGLKVVALSRRHDPAALLTTIVQRDLNPMVLVENKALYAQRPQAQPPAGMVAMPQRAEPGSYPPLAYASSTGHAAVTVVTYGGLTDLVEAVLEKLLLEEEIECDYFVLTQLYPLPAEGISASAARTGRLLIVEEGVLEYGVGAELAA